jgi:hypothetical protein
MEKFMKIKYGFLALFVFCVLAFTTCDFFNGNDDKNNGIPTVSTVTVSPSNASVAKGGTRNFSANVSGTNNPAQTVTWSIVETDKHELTTITGGTLTVASDESLSILTMRATSTIDTGKYGDALVTINDGSDDSQDDGDFFEPDEDLPPETPNPAAVVNPLLKTKWNQGNPYNLMLPMNGNTRILTSCDITAMAQIIKYHNYAQGSGVSAPYTTSFGASIPAINFANVNFDWGNMLDRYTRADPGTEQEQNAVANLMYHVKVAFWDTGAYDRVFTNFLGYDRDIERHYRVYYNDDDWEAIIKKQLDDDLPVYYRSSRDGGSHAFVVDGYDGTGKFHVNWGWSGAYDGWYSLDALKPREGRDYNSGHAIITNIKPDEGGTGNNIMALRNFSSSESSVVQNEVFTISIRLRGVSYFSGGHVGAALVDTNSEIIEVIGTRTRSSLHPSTTSSTYTINCFVPDSVNAGQYSLMAVLRPTGGEWKTITLSEIGNSIPSSISITVTAATGAPGGGYGMGLTVFTADKTTVSRNESFTITNQFRNLGTERYPGGHAGAVLIDNNNNIVEHVGIRENGALNVGANGNLRNMNCSVPITVPPGLYRLRIVVRPTGADEWRVATLSYQGAPTSIEFTVE